MNCKSFHNLLHLQGYDNFLSLYVQTPLVKFLSIEAKVLVNLQVLKPKKSMVNRFNRLDTCHAMISNGFTVPLRYMVLLWTLPTCIDNFD